MIGLGPAESRNDENGKHQNLLGYMLSYTAKMRR